MDVVVNDDMLSRILSSQENVSKKVLHRLSQAEAEDRIKRCGRDWFKREMYGAGVDNARDSFRLEYPLSRIAATVV